MMGYGSGCCPPTVFSHNPLTFNQESLALDVVKPALQLGNFRDGHRISPSLEELAGNNLNVGGSLKANRFS